MAKSKRKKSALIMCRNGKQFWTTQKQFWTWCKSGTVVKLADNPLRGRFVLEDMEKLVVIQKMVLNVAHPNHLREVLASKRFTRPK